MISIIGMACEFAGPADSLASFYDVIIQGKDATSKITHKRWKANLSELPDAVVHGGFLRRDPWGFDSQFFKISPKEAARMDPQHRHLLEMTYHALQDAGMQPEKLKGSHCGVFIGLGNNDYARLMHDSNDFAGLHGKGSLGSMAAGRISYHFDFTGPTFVVDTACSSSLVALHQALISLERGECDIAICGGVAHILTTDYSRDLYNAGVLSKEGRCKAFSKDADGFARGEGAGVIILERSDDAKRHGRRMYASILASAINGDGRSNGITAPSQVSQTRLILQALTAAKITPDDVTCIEAHGTGTNLGDKVEFSALMQVFGQKKSPLYVSSVKANIAHAEAAAGIAGVIKTSLCIYNKQLSPHRMADSIDPAYARALFLQNALPHEHIIAGVSSFGMSGSNAHVILGPEATRNALGSIHLYPFNRVRLIPEYAEASQFELELDDSYLKEHVINGVCIVPGSYYVETAQVLFKPACISNVTFIEPAVIREKAKLIVIRTRKSTLDYELSFVQERPVCKMTLSMDESTQIERVFPADIAAWKSTAPFYEQYARAGVTYGPNFKQLLQYVRLDDKTAFAEIQATENRVAFLDSCFQVTALCKEEVRKPFVPVTIQSARFYKPIESTMYCLSHITEMTDSYLEANLTIYNAKQEVAVVITGLICRVMDQKRYVYAVTKMEALPNAGGYVYSLQSGDPYDAFRAFFETVKRMEREVKAVSIALSSDDVKSRTLAKAIARVFPTEFPHIQFFVSKDVEYHMAPLPRPASPITIKSDGYYLITGGLSGVGRHIISKLGAKKIIVTSRSRPTGSMMVDGIEVLCKQVDLSKRDEVVKFFSELPRPLYGIFHLAGTTVDQSMEKISKESFQEVAGAKFHGAEFLDELSQTIEELEHFVLFSSMAAHVSSPGQLCYTYANLGLIAIAERRIQAGLPAKVIAWGPWENTGMMAKISKEAKSSAAIAQFTPLSPSICCESLIEILADKSSYHYAVYEQKEKAAVSEVVKSDSLADTVRTILAQETNYDISKIGMDAILSDLGIDSINLIRIRSELQDKLQLTIPLSLILDDSRVGTIVEELSKMQTKFYSLSYNQFSIWYEQHAVANTVAYNTGFAWKITRCNLTQEILQERWDKLVAEHDMLRAKVVQESGEIKYQILSSVKSAIHVETIDDEVEIKAYFKLVLERNIDFYQELPTRVYLVHHRSESYLLLSSHHIIMDASSIFYVGEKLIRSGSKKAELSAPYHDFVTKQREQSEQFCQKASQFLTAQIFDENHEPRRFELPKTHEVTSGKTLHIEFTDEEMQALFAIPQSQRVHLTLSAWALLLSRYSGEKEIVVGVAFNGRTEKKWSETIGHFVNVLPLSVSVDQTRTGSAYVTEVKQKLFELLEFQEFPLARLKALSLQTYFNYFDASQIDLDAEPIILEQQEAQFEISLWVVKEKNGYRFDIKYRGSVQAAEMAASFKKIIMHLCKKSDAALQELQLVPKPQTVPQIEHKKFVYDFFIEEGRKNPFAIAIEHNDQKVSYEELAHRVDQLATTFPDSIGEETVAIFVPERANIEFIVYVLMLWKKGYAYLPLNTKHPLERIRYMLEVAGCQKVVNVDPELPITLQPFVKEGKAEVASYEKRLAYILFTSGSTGLPKGVLVEHNGLIDRLLWMKKYFNFTSSDTFLQSTVLTFDISLPEFCLPLISGGTCVLSDGPLPICQHGVTMVSTVPSLFSVVQKELQACPTLKTVILVGEILPPAYVNEWLDSNTKATLYNLYGPTEATIYATYYPCKAPVVSNSVPIGAPCDHVVPLVLDAYGNEVPRGVVGELALAGLGIARGYIGYSQKVNPFTEVPYRTYKTGDFVRWKDEKTLEYLGRKDNRIKLNGQLIELSEIEQLVLQKFHNITNAACIVAEKQIILFVMPIVENIQEIFAHLEAHLPRYMIPSKIKSLPDFPRNASQKIDRRALSFALQEETCSTSTEKKRAETDFARQLVKLWEKVLQKEPIGVDESFFDLGGDSLQVTKMMLLAEKELKLKINFAKFLLHPTIEALLPQAAEGCLVTGATGHLGIHLVHAILTTTTSDIYVIMRGDVDRLKKRYVEVFAASFDFSRIHLYQGDLREANLGLDDTTYAHLCEKVSYIIHAAAEVNHALDYTRLKASNVDATAHILEFATKAKCKQFIYISTLFTEIGQVPEAYLTEGQPFISGYEKTKFMAEKLVEQANIPTSCLRLPLLVDEKDPHIARKNHFLALVEKCKQLGVYPDSLCAYDILPTEQVAAYIATIHRKGAPLVKNLRSDPSKLNDVFEKYELRKVDFPTWRTLVLDSTEIDDPFYRYLPLYTTDSSPLVTV